MQALLQALLQAPLLLPAMLTSKPKPSLSGVFLGRPARVFGHVDSSATLSYGGLGAQGGP